MRQLAIRVTAIALPILAVLLATELLLRLVPSLIGEAALVRFPQPLRGLVAKRLELPTNDDTVEIPTEGRVDHGPALRHMAPNTIFNRPLDPEDAAAGALARMTMDSNGFCNPRDKARRESAEIITLGDSFTFCHAVRAEDAAAAKIEELSHHTTYNLGVGGTGPYDYVEYLRNYGLKLKPRVVVMNLYEGNDLRDTLRYRDFIRTGRERDGRRITFADRAVSLSYVLSFLSAEYASISAAVSQKYRTDFRYVVRVQGKPVPMNVANSDPDEALSARSLLHHEIDMDGLLPPLQYLAELGKEHDFKPLVTYIPSLYTAYQDSVVFNDPNLGRDVQAFSKIQRQWLKASTARLGLDFLDLTPALQNAAQTGPLLYYPANVHLTPKGHLVVAETTAAKLAELGLAPENATTTN